MRAETGRAVLAATGNLGDAGPPLSSLVGRIAAGRVLAAVGASSGTLPPVAARPAPTLHPAADDAAARGPAARLVGAPPADRQLSAGGRVPPTAAVALLAAHGGAGVSCLLRAGLATAGAVDSQRRWPAAGRVLLVARTCTGGLEWARDLARQHASGRTGPDVELLGLVLVADAPGRLPARITRLADLVCGAFARCWQVPWLIEWRLASATEPLPVHPEVARLRADLLALTTDPRTTNPIATNPTATDPNSAAPALPAGPIRPVPSRGALL